MRSPAGPRRLGAATRISASLLRRLSVFFESTPGQDPKAAKFAFLIPGHAGFPNRVKRSEGSDTTPIQNATCFAVCALVCDFSPKAEGVPAFACESERGPFVGEVEKRDEKRSGTALVTAVLLEFPPLLDDGGSQGTGKCMYIKAWWNKRDIADSTRPRCGRGREGPCFAVCAVVCDPLSKGECVRTFARESERGPFVREAEKCDEKRLGIKFMVAALPDYSLLLVLRVHREPGNVCI